jgi:four helix bundle protein
MLRIYDVMLGVLQQLRPIVAAVSEHDADLARQLRRASTSVLLNLAEGSGSRAGTRRQRYHDARGSAEETIACLDAANALDYCAVDFALRDALGRIAATLTKVTR